MIVQCSHVATFPMACGVYSTVGCSWK